MLFEDKIWSVFVSIGAAIERLRERRGLLAASLVVSAILFALAMVYVRPSLPFFPSYLVGATPEYYAAAEDPLHFDFAQAGRGYRVVVPLLSYALGLRGTNLAYTTLLILYALVFTLFFRTYRKTGSPLAALAISSAFTFSADVLFNLFDISSAEGARILVTVLMVWVVPRRLLFWFLFLVLIFIHEGAAVFLPFFLLLRWPHRHGLARFAVFDLGAALLIVGVYMFFFRSMPHAQYLSPWAAGMDGFVAATKHNLHKWLWFGYDGFFSGLKLYWLPVFAAIGLALRERKYYDALLAAAPIGGFAAMMVVSWETTRFALLAAPAMLVAFDQLRRRYGDEATARLFLVLGAVNLFVPQQVTYGGPLGPLPSLPHMLMFWIFGHAPGAV